MNHENKRIKMKKRKQMQQKQKQKNINPLFRQWYTVTSELMKMADFAISFFFLFTPENGLQMNSSSSRRNRHQIHRERDRENLLKSKKIDQRSPSSINMKKKQWIKSNNNKTMMFEIFFLRNIWIQLTILYIFSW